ncbi:MAG: RND family transporter [Calditrichaeota bacterium]|nr:RND family transporter [Calditrichota bacterium]
MIHWIDQLLNKPLRALLILLGISAVFFVTMRNNSRMETDLDKYMPQNHPAFIYSNQAEDWFDIKDGIIIALENPQGIYHPTTLRKVKDLTRKLQKMPEIEKNDVTSLYTADNIVGTEDGLDVKSFYRRVPESDEALNNLREKVRANEMVYGRLVSRDETVTIIIARVGDDTFSQEFYHRLKALVKEYEGPEKVYIAGRPIVEGTMAYLGPKDMKRMVPIVIGVIILVLYLVLRNVRSTLLTLLVVVFSVIWTFGLMALLEVPIYAVSTMIPVMLIAIGVADGIHLFSHLYLFLKENPQATKKEAVVDMIREMWRPVVMTSVTTAVGFVSLVTSQVYPIKYFGLFTAFGVLVAMLFSLVFIPAGIMLLGLPRPHKKIEDVDEDREADLFAHKFAEGIARKKWITFLAVHAVVLFSIIGMNRVWINSSFLEKFEKDSEIVQTDRFINSHFGGTNTLNVILEGDEEDTFKQPAVLTEMVRMQEAVQHQLPVVGNSFSLGDYLKRMNKVMHADSARYERIPDSQNLIAQYLLLYEMSGDPENLWQVVTEDYQKANITFQLKSDNSRALKKAIAVIESFRPRFEEQGIQINYAGSGYKALVFTDLILEGQITSLLLSLVIVIALLALMFRSFTVGLIGAVPIILTAMISFGVMGLLNIPLSTTTALISSIAVGIGIDYAVHFIERYRIYARQTESKVETIKLTMHHSGRAIIFNALVVIAGFLVLLFSVFPPNRVLGALVSLNMFTSFLGTITIMFLLLYVTNMYFKTPKETIINKEDKS